LEPFGSLCKNGNHPELMENEREGEGKALATSRRPNIDEHLAASCRHYFDEKIVFKTATQPDAYIERLKSNYRPLNPRMPELNPDKSPGGGSGNPAASSSSSGDHETPRDSIPAPKRVLYDPGQLEMKWKIPRSVGAGLSNIGNTCFLNSVLQCLTYTPPLFHYLTSDHHKRLCRSQGFCAMCELQKHTQRVMNTTGGVVKPVPFVQNLRVIGKHFRQGRQEDAHEFLRYFVDGLQKGSLQGLPVQLDPHSKATTVVHQVFGGYHCSAVKCSECQKTSETFDPLLDLSLDIKTCGNLKQALNRFTKPDALDGENQYACPL
jgi:ubiquitin carboxyl-terminal hydrolase 36/42